MRLITTRTQNRNLQALRCLLLAMLAVSACKSHTAVTPAQQKAVQSVAQQPAPAQVETDQEKSCRVFVQGFYDWYFDRLNNASRVAVDNPIVDDVLRLKPEVLTARLRQTLKEDREAASKNHDEIVGLDFDPYINAQDWDGKYYIESATVKGSICRASVWGMDSGATREIVVPELEFNGGKWVFANFLYHGQPDQRNENLIDLLIALRNDR